LVAVLEYDVVPGMSRVKAKFVDTNPWLFGAPQQGYLEQGLPILSSVRLVSEQQKPQHFAVEAGLLGDGYRSRRDGLYLDDLAHRANVRHPPQCREENDFHTIQLETKERSFR
jgi:hypothetical protein